MKFYCIKIKSRKTLTVFLFLLVFLFVFLDFVNVESSTASKVLTNEDRILAISELGYDVVDEVVEVKDILIPENFNDTYEKYNQIQIKGGFNLKNYSGEKATLYKYLLRDTHDTEYVNLIIHEGIIIGGDVSSTRLNGEMRPL